LVANKLHKEEVQALMSELSGDKPGGKGWISFIQQAVTQVMQSKSEAENKNFEALAEEWRSQPVPREIQIQ